MNINPNHKQDGEAAWKKSGLTCGQTVKYNGEEYTATAIGYGMLFDGKIRITDKHGNKKIVNLSELEATE